MSKVRSALDKLSLRDTYSMIMFVLFKCKEIPEIAPLSELIYLVDEDTVVKLLKYFGGQTITFPKIQDLEILIYSLTLYQQVEIDGQEFDVCISSIPSEHHEEVMSMYNKICEVMGDYTFA